MHTRPNSAVHYDCAAQGIRKKKRGQKLDCPREFQKLRLTFLEIDARDVAYKARLGLAG